MTALPRTEFNDIQHQDSHMGYASSAMFVLLVRVVVVGDRAHFCLTVQDLFFPASRRIASSCVSNPSDWCPFHRLTHTS